MKSVTIPLQKTPQIFVKKYLSTRIGFNIQVGKIVKNENKTWTVSLNAVIPSFVKSNGTSLKTFRCIFDNIGEAIVKYDNYDYGFVKIPKT